MKSYRRTSYVIALALSVATLSGCGTPQTPVAVQPATVAPPTTAPQPTTAPTATTAPTSVPQPTGVPTTAPQPTVAPTPLPATQVPAPSPAPGGGNNPCGGAPKGNFEQRAGQNGEYCVVWTDTFTDETAFRITIEYGNMERFVYDAPANSTWFVVPATDTPQPGNCGRSTFSLTLEAVQPSGTALVNGMAMDGECRP